MTDERVERFDSGSIEINEWGFSEKVEVIKFLLGDEFRLYVHGFFKIDFEHDLAIEPLSGDYLGYRLCYLFLLQTLDEIL